MLSIELLRRDPDAVRAALARRREDADVVEALVTLDGERRKLIVEGDALRERRNESSKAIGVLMRGGGGETDAQREEVRQIGERLKALDDDLAEVDGRLRTQMLTLPNIPAEGVPDGDDETGNVVVRSDSPLPLPSYPLKPHWELFESLGLTDFERGAKLSGSRFYVLKEPGVRLQRALVLWMLDLHRRVHGYTEVGVPLLVRSEVMEGSGNLPKFADNLYHDDEDDLWLIPTAEVPLTNLHRDEILDPGTLPIRYMAHTQCFRREKAAAGRDTRGIKRVHQFEKVEMYQFVAPEESDHALDQLVAHAEEACAGLGIPHRVLQLCTGDLSFPSAMSYDVEMWSPASEEWLEVSSCSNCTDFQARRANIRFRREAGGRPELVHTLNGSGLAIPRVMIAIVETFQQADGIVRLPEVLVPYMGGQLTLEPVG